MRNVRRPAGIGLVGDPKTFRMVMLTVIKKHTTGRFILPNT